MRRFVPPRDPRLRIQDILVTIDRIQRYTDGLTFDTFCADQKTVDAVIRNFEVMGEAARHVDERTAQMSRAVPWLDVGDMRNILIHEYFGVDLRTVWKTISEDLPPLKGHLDALLTELNRNS
jgi:uncharacterized protein with HEPN domain